MYNKNYTSNDHSNEFSSKFFFFFGTLQPLQYEIYLVRLGKI